jgi:tRNA 2-selenouridine synthase
LPQPTNEQFENNLYQVWSLLDFSRPVWIEDESRMIGNVTLPDPVLTHLGSGILVKVEMEMERRVGRLVREYAQFGKTELTAAITKISERLGGARTREALKALEAGRFDLVAEIALAYYDKAYHHSLDRRHPDAILSFRLKDADAAQNASEILELTYNHLKHGTGLPGL